MFLQNSESVRVACQYYCIASRMKNSAKLSTESSKKDEESLVGAGVSSFRSDRRDTQSAGRATEPFDHEEQAALLARC